MKRRCKELDLLHILIIPGSGRIMRRFKEAGLQLFLGSGFDPGVTSVFTAYALKHYFDEITPLIFWTAMAETTDIHLQPTLIRRSTFVRYLPMVPTGRTVTG